MLRVLASSRRRALALLLLAACNRTSPSREWSEQEAAGPDSLGLVPTAREIRPRLRQGLSESSAVVASVAQPGVLFTINDSGHEPVLYALDTTGADRGAWRVRGARNRDWEAAALGPCGAEEDAGAPAAGVPGCVYIGEVGDNNRQDPWAAVYRIAEPATIEPPRTGEVAAERLRFRYAGGRHDVEAMLVGADGTMHFVTKRPLADASGRRRPALVFTLPASAWRDRDSIHVAALTDSLPIVPGSAIGRQITDAARSADGRWAAVRSYLQVWIFAADPVTGRIRTTVRPSVCNVVDLDERQGEGVAWLGAEGPLLLVSEGRKEPWRVIECPLPRG